MRFLTVAAMGVLCCATAHARSIAKKPAVGIGKVKQKTMAELLKESPASDWRPLDPENTLYLELPDGRVVIELAPTFAPNHIANVKALAREKYFDGLAVMRAQDNYVVQWGDPEEKRQVQKAQKRLAAEFERALGGLHLVPLADPDTYAAKVGFIDHLPAATDPKSGKAWLVHCYGMIGAGRDSDADSGGGTELYAVVGHSPRHLDRNVTLLGRVVQGIELLSTLRRGTGNLGFYDTPAERTAVNSMRVAADVPAEERTNLELLRTDSKTFAAVVAARRNRTEDWFKVPAGRIDLCNVPLPVRAVEK